MNDHRHLANMLSRQYIGSIFDSYPNGKDCGYFKLTFYYIRIIELEDDFGIHYGYHFDKDMNFLGYGYLPKKVRTIEYSIDNRLKGAIV